MCFSCLSAGSIELPQESLPYVTYETVGRNLKQPPGMVLKPCVVGGFNPSEKY